MLITSASNVQFLLFSEVTSGFFISFLPFKRVSNLEHYSIIITKLHSHLIRMQKSHLHGTSLGEEFNTAILYCGTKWISECLHTLYHIFVFYVDSNVPTVDRSLLSIRTSISLLVMKSPVVE